MASHVKVWWSCRLSWNLKKSTLQSKKIEPTSTKGRWIELHHATTKTTLSIARKTQEHRYSNLSQCTPLTKRVNHTWVQIREKHVNGVVYKLWNECRENRRSATIGAAATNIVITQNDINIRVQNTLYVETLNAWNIHNGNIQHLKTKSYMFAFASSRPKLK